MKETELRAAARVARIAAVIFSAAVDHAPHAHAFEYSEETVLDATASARRYAVAQARALLAEVDARRIGERELREAYSAVHRQRDALLAHCRPCDIDAANASIERESEVAL